MKVDRAAGRGRLARPADVHPHHRHRFGVGFVVRVLARHPERLAGVRARVVAVAADLERRPQFGLRRRNRAWVVAVDDMYELAHTGQLVANEGPGALADMAMHAVDARMRRVLPGRVLRAHGRMARLPAERRRFHVVQAAVPGQQQNRDIDGRERGDDERRATNRRHAEVEDRPIRDGRGIAPQRALHEPAAERHQQQPEKKDRRQRDEDDQAGVGIVEETGRRRHRERQEHDGRGRRDQRPDD